MEGIKKLLSTSEFWFVSVFVGIIVSLMASGIWFYLFNYSAESARKKKIKEDEEKERFRLEVEKIKGDIFLYNAYLNKYLKYKIYTFISFIAMFISFGLSVAFFEDNNGGGGVIFLILSITFICIFFSYVDNLNEKKALNKVLDRKDFFT